jgi:DHA2 family multidrug resistance protein
MLSRLTSHCQGSDAQSMALKQMMGIVRQQATVMSFADVFLILTVLFVVLAVFGVIMRRPQLAAAVSEAH